MLNTNDALRAEGKVPATYTNLLLGITKASLSTDSSSLRRPSRKPPRADRSRHHGQARRAAWPEGKRHRGSPDPQPGTGLAYHEARKARESMDEAERRAIADAEAAELAGEGQGESPG